MINNMIMPGYLLSTLLIPLLFFTGCSPSEKKWKATTADEMALQIAQKNGALVNEGFERSQRFVNDWLKEADPATGLIPRNLTNSRDIWNAKDAAADNYPFMVLTSVLTDQALFEGRMKEMLATETKLTSRVDHLPDTYSFSKKGYDREEVDLDDILFGSSEYIKDGLLPLTEWLGPSPWSERMIDILDDMWKHAPIATPYGPIVSTNVELNGEMLQTLSRIYWMTGDQKYLNWAIRLGDYYLLDDHHPTRDFKVLRLRDHGCEVVSGLCELYATVSYANPEKKKEYQPQIKEMLDRILEVGRNEDGLFYNAVNPLSGEITSQGVADNFGYNLNGFYTVYQIDSIDAYRTATLKALNALQGKYNDFDWESGSADGYADAVEGALNLFNREPIEDTKTWIDSEIQVMWSMQDSSQRANTQQWHNSGIIEGWHGDGNFARTTIMYCLWKSLGSTISPWRSDMELGAAMNGQDMVISISIESDWKGKLMFDTKRHETIMHLPFDWPRINQFPEWFTAEEKMNYELINWNDSSSTSLTGQQLIAGIPFSLTPGVHQFTLKRSGD